MASIVIFLDLYMYEYSKSTTGLPGKFEYQELEKRFTKSWDYFFVHLFRWLYSVSATPLIFSPVCYPSLNFLF
jgi:hypothetical protein